MRIFLSKLNMELSSDAVFELLDLYEKESALWNPKHPLHKNRNEIREGWQRIQSTFSIECSVDDLKKKKDSLMATFRPLLKKVKSSMKSGAGSGDIFKPTWFAYEKMAKFLISVYEPRITINTEELSKVAEEEGESQEDQEGGGLDREAAAPSHNSTNRDQGNAFKSPVPKRNRKRKLMSIETIQSQMSDAYKIMKTVATKPPTQKDSCSVYADLLAMKLREFDELNRAKIMNEIDNLIFRTKMSLNPPGPPAHSFYQQQFSSAASFYHNTPESSYVSPPSLSPQFSEKSPSPQNSAGYHSPSQSPCSPELMKPNSTNSQESSSSEYTQLSPSPWHTH